MFVFSFFALFFLLFSQSLQLQAGIKDWLFGSTISHEVKKNDKKIGKKNRAELIKNADKISKDISYNLGSFFNTSHNNKALIKAARSLANKHKPSFWQGVYSRFTDGKETLVQNMPLHKAAMLIKKELNNIAAIQKQLYKYSCANEDIFFELQDQRESLGAVLKSLENSKEYAQELSSLK